MEAVSGGIERKFYLSVLIRSATWATVWRASNEHEAAIFPGAVSEWTADQRRIVSLQRELTGIFQLCGIKDVPMPPESVLLDYEKLLRFKDQVSSGDAAKRTQHTHGWKVG